MADLTCTAQNPFVFTLDGEVNSAGEIVADLRPSAVVAAGGAMLADMSNGAGISAALGDFADDAAAATGGVVVGAPYRTGSILKVRVA